jgi:hypothetical protein
VPEVSGKKIHGVFFAPEVSGKKIQGVFLVPECLGKKLQGVFFVPECLGKKIHGVFLSPEVPGKKIQGVFPSPAMLTDRQRIDTDRSETLSGQRRRTFGTFSLFTIFVWATARVAPYIIHYSLIITFFTASR